MFFGRCRASPSYVREVEGITKGIGAKIQEQSQLLTQDTRLLVQCEQRPGLKWVAQLRGFEL